MKKKILTQTYIESTNELSCIKMYQEKEETVYYRDKYKKKYIMIDLDKMEQYQSISHATMAKVAYLASYCDYNNRLMLTERTCMRKSNLSTVLNISKRSCCEIKHELIDLNMLQISSTGEMFLSDDLFYRGKRDCNKMKVNVEALRSTYLNSTPRSMKNLGRIIFLAPYINKTHNVICNNPNETDYNFLHHLTIKEICEILKYNYDGNNSGRLISDFLALMFEYKGETQPVCFIDYSHKKGNQKMISINPNFISAGQIF